MLSITPIFNMFLQQSGNQYIQFNSELIVPPIPPRPKVAGTYFLWPGLQAGFSNTNFLPIDNGVLQPVLTYGPTCAPNQLPEQIENPYFSWAISALYVNTYGTHPGYTGCLGGDFMAVNPGDTLKIEMKLLTGTTKWFQKVTSAATQKSVEFTIDLLGQKQGWAEYVIELYYEEATLSNVIMPIRNIELIVEKINDPGFCNFNAYASNVLSSKTCSQPKLSKDNTTCTIDYCKYPDTYVFPTTKSSKTSTRFIPSTSTGTRTRRSTTIRTTTLKQNIKTTTTRSRSMTRTRTLTSIVTPTGTMVCPRPLSSCGSGDSLLCYPSKFYFCKDGMLCPSSQIPCKLPNGTFECRSSCR